MLLHDLHTKKHTKYLEPDDWLKYKQIRNEIDVDMKTKRNSYFSQKLEQSRGDIKETWRVLNTAVRHKPKTTVNNSLDVNSNTINDPETSAEELNLHFSTIADLPTPPIWLGDPKYATDSSALMVHITKISR